MTDNIKEKIFVFLESSKKKEHKKDLNKIVTIGKNRSKVSINPTVKESKDDKPLSPSEKVRAINFPEGVLADKDASSELKDYANAILQLRLSNN